MQYKQNQSVFFQNVPNAPGRGGKGAEGKGVNAPLIGHMCNVIYMLHLSAMTHVFGIKKFILCFWSLYYTVEGEGTYSEGFF